MKKFITLFLLFQVFEINAQIIDINHFDMELMDSVLFTKMSNYHENNGFCSLTKASMGQKRISRFIKMNNERLSPDDLNKEINFRILRKYESQVLARTNIVGNVSLIDCFKMNGILTYQAIADSCITYWTNSENLIFMNWSQIGETVTYLNKREQVVYVFFVYLQ